MAEAKVLLVDDDPGVRAAIGRALGTEGFEVLATGEAAEVIGIVEHESPDLILLDLGLGEESGWDVFETISRDHPLIPVVIISALSGQFEMACEAGVGAFVEKPIEIPRLVATMRQLLEESTNTRLKRLAQHSPRPEYVPRKDAPGSQNRQQKRGGGGT